MVALGAFLAVVHARHARLGVSQAHTTHARLGVSHAHTTHARGHACGMTAVEPLALTFHQREWSDAFRGAERAVQIIALDATTGEQCGSLGVELLPMTRDGFRSTAENACSQLLLSGLVVDVALRRRGIGRRLVGEAEALARSWGFDELLLHVADSNKAAVGLYSDLGYRRADGTALTAEPKAERDEDARPWDVSSWVRWLPRGSETVCLRKML
jgi:GNAT superfamily N-acetyltransferase